MNIYTSSNIGVQFVHRQQRLIGISTKGALHKEKIKLIGIPSNRTCTLRIHGMKGRKVEHTECRVLTEGVARGVDAAHAYGAATPSPRIRRVRDVKLDGVHLGPGARPGGHTPLVGCHNPSTDCWSRHR